MKKRTSIKDVAEKANVSTALVSYVLNERHMNRISKETAARVRKVAEELNYRPNRIAQSLKSNRTQTIGLVVREIADINTGQLVQFIEEEFTKKNYAVFIGCSNYRLDKQKDIINTFLNHQVDGIIIQPTEGSDAYLEKITENNIPILLLDHYLESVNIPVVTTNNFGASYQAIESLTLEKKKHIGVISYQSELLYIEERIKGIKSATEKYELALDIKYVKTGYKSSQEEINNFIDELVNEKSIDALFFTSSRLAMLGLKKLMQLNLAEKISILTFDGSEVFDLLDLPITYIKQPMEQMAQNSSDILLEMINSKDYKPKNRIYNSRIVKV